MLRKILKTSTKRIPLPRYRLPELENVLVIAPHMDDEIVGCGGFIKKLSKNRAKFHVVYITDGCRGNSNMIPDENLGAIRKQEAKKGLESLMKMETFQQTFLELEDGNVSSHVDEIEKLVELLKNNSFDGVFVPYCMDLHPDHRAANVLFCHALKKAAVDMKGKFYFYEVWTPLIPNLVIDITDEYEEKCEAMRCHKTQTKTKQYVEMIHHLNGFRACFANRDEIKYAEAFYQCSQKEYCDLVEESRKTLW